MASIAQMIIERVTNPQFMLALVVAALVVATVLGVGLPLLEGDTLGKRVKAVGVERDRIRQRERQAALTAGPAKGNLRPAAKPYMAQLVELFSLERWLGTQKAKGQLAMAGFRGQRAATAFLFARFVTPIVFMLVAAFYVFVILPPDLMPTPVRFGAPLFAAYLGLKGPEIYVKNKTAKRQVSMRRAFPDALDLLLICVESGMSIEVAFNKVASEIASASLPLSEEFVLLTAELSFLPNRRTAYDNLYARTGLDSVKSIVTVLVQAERYGTPLGAALRIVSQESRDFRMMEAEKKAASLPPKLTVPMIVFFLPILFAVLITPAAIQISAAMK